MGKNRSDIASPVGRVLTAEDGKQYFVCGKNHIEISEHFATTGKKLDDLLTDVMLYTAEGKISA
ncbi:MAG: hypothetical protein IKL28_06065 [Lachnospiraceae bacterium]|nr:hypothetical protein [Lachnospiraceae bacterium]